MSGNYSIKDLERISGIKAHTLRIWEQRYNILRPARTSTNIRYYGDTDLKRLLNIALLNNNGHKISKIAKLTDEEILSEVEKFLNASRRESDQIETLVLCLMDMNEDRFEDTINQSVQKFGFENTFEKIVFPFLRHLGKMWQVSLITPAQEHYISNLIRQKLIVGIDALKFQQSQNPRTFLFFLPNNELHELGLIYAHYLARKGGHKCVYLGQCVPVEDILTISRATRPDVLVTIITSQLNNKELNEVISTCASQLPDTDIFLSGRLFFEEEQKVLMPSDRCRLFRDFSEFRALIEKL